MLGQTRPVSGKNMFYSETLALRSPEMVLAFYIQGTTRGQCDQNGVEDREKVGNEVRGS